MSDRLRDVVVLTCAVSAGIHAALAPDHFHERFAAGLGFAVSAVLLAGLAAALARSASPLLYDAAAVVLAGLIVAYVLAVTTGVPGLVPDAEPVDWIALVTKLIEGVGLVAALAVRGQPSALGRPRSIPLIAMVVAFSALVVVAVSDGNHAHGDHDHEGAHAHVG